MSDEKKSFLLYIDSLDVVDDMDVEQKAELFQAIIDFNKGKEPILKGLMKAVFVQFKNQFERDAIKYEAVKVKRSLAGKQGGRPKKEEESSEEEKAKKANGFSEKQTEAKKADTVNVTVNDTVTVIKENTAHTQKIFDLDYFKSIGYEWNLSPKIYASLNSFLIYRGKPPHKDSIRAPESVEAIIRRFGEFSESDVVEMISRTLEKQAKNIIFELAKKQENGRTEKIGRHTTDAMAKFING